MRLRALPQSPQRQIKRGQLVRLAPLFFDTSFVNTTHECSSPRVPLPVVDAGLCCHKGRCPVQLYGQRGRQCGPNVCSSRTNSPSSDKTFDEVRHSQSPIMIVSKLPMSHQAWN